MMPRALLGLLGLGAVFAVAIGLELAGVVADEGAMIASTPRPSPARPSTPAGAPIARGIQEDLADGVFERPLFAPARRRATVAATSAAPLVNLPRLAGILVNGGSRSVIFAAAEGSRPMVAHEGAQVGGYIVQSIEAGQVTLSGPGGPQVLRPSFDPQPRVSATSVAVGLPALPTPATDVLQSLRKLPGFSGIAPGVAR